MERDTATGGVEWWMYSRAEGDGRLPRLQEERPRRKKQRAAATEASNRVDVFTHRHTCNNRGIRERMKRQEREAE